MGYTGFSLITRNSPYPTDMPSDLSLILPFLFLQNALASLNHFFRRKMENFLTEIVLSLTYSIKVISHPPLLVAASIPIPPTRLSFPYSLATAQKPKPHFPHLLDQSFYFFFNFMHCLLASQFTSLIREYQSSLSPLSHL